MSRLNHKALYTHDNTFTQHGITQKAFQPTVSRTELFVTTRHLEVCWQVWKAFESSQPPEVLRRNARMVIQHINTIGKLMDHLLGEFLAVRGLSNAMPGLAEMEYFHNSIIPYEVWLSIKIALHGSAKKAAEIYKHHLDNL